MPDAPELFSRPGVLIHTEGDPIMWRCGVFALGAALLTGPLCAQPADWEKLRELAPDQRVSALTHDNKYIEGRFRSWSAEGLQVYANRREEWVKEPDVKRVWVRKKAPRWRSALIGAAVGFGATFAFGAAKAGYIADQNNPRFGTRMGVGAAFGLFGAGIGAGIGALAGGTKNELIYRAGDRQ
jgi:hypothetical protein